MPTVQGKIFINYRRGDDPGNTGRLFDRLQETFAPDQLFIDVDNIRPGLDFVKVLDQQVSQCDVLLAVIGRSWLDARDETGARRLDDENDFVRVEIEAALNQDKLVIPVLVGDAHMPRAVELPDSLKPLARRNAVRLTHERFRADTQGFVRALQEALAEMQAQRHAEAAAAREAEATRHAQAEAAHRAQAEAVHRAEAESARNLAEEASPEPEAEYARGTRGVLSVWREQRLGAQKRPRATSTFVRFCYIGIAAIVIALLVAIALGQL